MSLRFPLFLQCQKDIYKLAQRWRAPQRGCGTRSRNRLPVRPLVQIKRKSEFWEREGEIQWRRCAQVLVVVFSTVAVVGSKSQLHNSVVGWCWHFTCTLPPWGMGVGGGGGGCLQLQWKCHQKLITLILVTWFFCINRFSKCGFFSNINLQYIICNDNVSVLLTKVQLKRFFKQRIFYKIWDFHCLVTTKVLNSLFSLVGY